MSEKKDLFVAYGFTEKPGKVCLGCMITQVEPNFSLTRDVGKLSQQIRQHAQYPPSIDVVITLTRELPQDDVARNWLISYVHSRNNQINGFGAIIQKLQGPISLGELETAIQQAGFSSTVILNLQLID